jgi:hypothetical protein
MADYDDRPWEQAGCVRRDYEPHRAGLLGSLATLCLVLSVFCFVFPPLVLVVAPFGFWVYWTAKEDIARMRTGEIDRRGMQPMEWAAGDARRSALLSLVFSVLSAAVSYAIFRRLKR